MAVSAHEGGFYVYTLKSMVVLTQEFRDGLGLCPIKEVGESDWPISIKELMQSIFTGKINSSRGNHIEDGIPSSLTK